MAIKRQALEAISHIERLTGKKFGDARQPLLVSVRSGAKFSMPGMMDTILNIGLNDNTIKGLIRQTGHEHFAYDAYRRLLQMFGEVVMGVPRQAFDRWTETHREQQGIDHDSQLAVEDLKDMVEDFKALIREHAKKEFPQDPRTQLAMAQETVFRSWNNPRAVTYRKLNNIPYRLGTAVTVQAMVFGNRGEDSGTGVGFTRNPVTGKRELFGEYLPNAQGEDVVAGLRTPLPLIALRKQHAGIYRQLAKIVARLEKHFHDAQDFEFTVECGTLYMLQTRSAKRTAPAAVKMAVDMVREKLIPTHEALIRVTPDQISQMLHPVLDDSKPLQVVAKGLPASPGAVSGRIVLTADEAAERGGKEPVILVRAETSPDDIHGMHAAVGVLTARGGMTSHAAVVARGMGKCCIVGCEALKIDERQKSVGVNGRRLLENDWITLDGGSGRVIVGKVPTQQPVVGKEFSTFLGWADQYRDLKVRANADTPEDAKQARQFGAEGIGLCRTEHMFFAADRLPVMQEMIMAGSKEARQAALEKLLPMQRRDFLGMFREMAGFPVTIRTLDPPLHEFLPKREDVMVEIAKLEATGSRPNVLEEKRKLLSRINALSEANPMLGHRGCRLGITYPEITWMQSKAIFEAACQLRKEGKSVFPEIMIPLVGDAREFHHQWKIVVGAGKEVMRSYGTTIHFTVGTMIEIPRAALLAGEDAAAAEFFSFGTHDLTQTTYGFSRDDTGKFLDVYAREGIMSHDPFMTLDRLGVGQLMKIAVERGRKVRRNLKVGICGEHGGDPASVAFCHDLGLDYVSCSPFRVPTARLAAAQAAMGTLTPTGHTA